MKSSNTMRFHLNFTPPVSPFKINHAHKVFLIGSCFSNNIGNFLEERRFKTHSNPAGNLFNPFSIESYLLDSVQQTKPNTDHFIQSDYKVLSYKHHSSVNAASTYDLENQISIKQNESLKFLKTCDFLFITFGTAYYYHHTSLDLIVANCHKQASSYFKKVLAKQESIVSTYTKLIEELKTLNPKINVIFTVSPVKHLKDGVLENTLSKSTLHLAVNELVSSHEKCFYFPAYELVNDDLRDYRFYKEDLAHPNELAIQYVWDKFSDTYFDSDTKDLNLKIEKLNLALSHKTSGISSVETDKFSDYIQKLQAEIKSKLLI